MCLVSLTHLLVHHPKGQRGLLNPTQLHCAGVAELVKGVRAVSYSSAFDIEGGNRLDRQ